MPKHKNVALRRPLNTSTRWLALAFIALLPALATAFDHSSARADGLFDYFWSPDKLETVTTGITKRYPGISHITTSQLATKLSQDNNSGTIVLVDVRQTPEYQVSHLKGAVHAEPDTDIATLRQNLPSDLTGKTIVFYCSVGERSSQLAQRMKDALMAQGALGVYNLSGGIFAWHNEKRSLFNAGGSTDFVHPFNSHWGRLVDRQQLTRMTPLSTQPPQTRQSAP